MKRVVPITSALVALCLLSTVSADPEPKQQISAIYRDGGYAYGGGGGDDDIPGKSFEIARRWHEDRRSDIAQAGIPETRERHAFQVFQAMRRMFIQIMAKMREQR